jgi:hypothetical protein
MKAGLKTSGKYVALTCSSVALVSIVAWISTGRASVRTPELHFDAGTITYGEVVRHKFVYRNSGRRTLDVIDMRADCGCTSVKLSARRVQPGQTTEANVEIDTALVGGIAGPERDMKLERRVTLLTTAARHPSIVLRITGIMEREFVFPNDVFIDFGDVAKGSKMQRVILVRRAGRSEIIDANSTDERFGASLLDSGPDQVNVRVLAWVEGKSKPGRYVGSIVLRTSSKVMPEVRIPVRALILSGSPAIAEVRKM